MDDSELLARYIDTGSTDAFNQLMLRHVDLVYSAARRQVHDVHLTEDITQAVFIILSQKAKSVRSGGALPGWLLLTTHYAAKDARKLEFRRRVHEYKAAQMRTAHDKDQDKAWREVEPGLDAALAKLRGRQRSIVALHYMEGRTFREVGQTLGMSEDAARMACGRAIEKLRGSLNLPVVGTSVTLGMLLASRKTQAAPQALRAAIAANSTTGCGASSTALTIARGVGSGMSVKIGSLALTTIIAVIAASIITGVVLTSTNAMWNHRNRIVIGEHLPIDDSGVSFISGGRIEFLGLAHYPDAGGMWWRADGSASSISLAGLSSASATDRAESDRVLYQFAFRVSDLPADAGDLWLYAAGDFPGFRNVRMQRGQGDNSNIYYGIAALSPQQTVTNIAIAHSTGGMQSMRLDAKGHLIGKLPNEMDCFIPQSITGSAGKTTFILSSSTDPYLKFGFSAIALASDETEHPRLMSTKPYQGQIGDNSHQGVFTFDIAPQKIREFRIDRARSREWITFRHISLAAGTRTSPFAENSHNPSTDRSVHDKAYLALLSNLVAAIKKQNIAAASAFCDQFAAGTSKRASSLEGTPYNYLAADGQPVLEQLQAALQRGDLSTALALVDAGTSSGARLWEMTLQLSINNHAESLQYP